MNTKATAINHETILMKYLPKEDNKVLNNRINSSSVILARIADAAVDENYPVLIGASISLSYHDAIRLKKELSYFIAQVHNPENPS